MMKGPIVGIVSLACLLSVTLTPASPSTIEIPKGPESP
jgi:hypothetical protein